MTLLFAFLIGLFAREEFMLALLTHQRDMLKTERFFNTIFPIPYRRRVLLILPIYVLTVLDVWRMVRAESHDLESCSRRLPSYQVGHRTPGLKAKS